MQLCDRRHAVNQHQVQRQRRALSEARRRCGIAHTRHEGAIGPCIGIPAQAFQAHCHGGVALCQAVQVDVGARIDEHAPALRLALDCFYFARQRFAGLPAVFQVDAACAALGSFSHQVGNGFRVVAVALLHVHRQGYLDHAHDASDRCHQFGARQVAAIGITQCPGKRGARGCQRRCAGRLHQHRAGRVPDVGQQERRGVVMELLEKGKMVGAHGDSGQLDRYAGHLNGDAPILRAAIGQNRRQNCHGKAG